ncbi:MAG: hypothetical protein M3Y17_09690 [Actinomycetota bacterium]|nr:hypothetical protein [Actinomycetota bacterium]
MLARDTSENLRTAHGSDQQFEPGIKELLDHIAVELAAEYVRLMEAAAGAAEPSPTNSD